MNVAARRAWARTSLRVWTGTYRLVRLPREALGAAAAALADGSDGFLVTGEHDRVLARRGGHLDGHQRNRVNIGGEAKVGAINAQFAVPLWGDGCNIFVEKKLCHGSVGPY